MLKHPSPAPHIRVSKLLLHVGTTGLAIAWGWGGHKKRYIYLGSADLNPGNITYTTENGHNSVQKENCTECDQLCKCSTRKRAMDSERRGDSVLVESLEKYNCGKSM